MHPESLTKNDDSVTKGLTSNSLNNSRLFCSASYWNFLKVLSNSSVESKEAHRGRDTHEVCCYVPVLTCNSQTCGWGIVRTLYADVLGGACLTPTNLCGVSAVVSPYLLLPLVSRLVTWRIAEWNTATSHAADGQMRAFIRSEGSEELNFMTILNLHRRQTPFSSASADLDF